MPDLLGRRHRRIGVGFEIGVRLPWYRSLPLSCVDIRLAVDGEDVGEERIRLHANDRDYALGDLRDLWDEFWFVLDEAGLRVTAGEELAVGEHEVAVEMVLRPPYIFDEETGQVVSFRRSDRVRVNFS